MKFGLLYFIPVAALLMGCAHTGDQKSPSDHRAMAEGRKNNLNSHYVIFDFRPEDPGDEPWGMFVSGEEVTGIEYSDEPMEEVIAQLAGFFGIEIKMPSELAQRRITVRFGNVSCLAMVRSIVDEKDFDIQSSTKTISIIRRGVPQSSIIYIQREPYCD